MTMRQLLSHTSGIRHYKNPVKEEIADKVSRSIRYVEKGKTNHKTQWRLFLQYLLSIPRGFKSLLLEMDFCANKPSANSRGFFLHFTATVGL